MTMPYLIALIAFSSVALVVWASLSAVFSDEKVVNRRLTGLTSYESDQALAAHPQLQTFGQRVIKPGREVVRRRVSTWAPAGYRDALRRKLELAGRPNGLDAERFITAKTLIAGSVGALGTGICIFTSSSGLTWLMSAALTVAAFIAPDLWLSSVVDMRKRQIRTSLPDLLDMLTISVEAGLGFDQAIAKIVRSTRGPLSEELARALQEMQAGTDRSDALKHLAERTDVPQLSAFITAIVQAEQLGIPIAKVLRTQAAEMRLTRRQQAEEQAQKTPVKIVFPLILCILPATLIVILGPAIVSIGSVFGAW